MGRRHRLLGLNLIIEEFGETNDKVTHFYVLEERGQELYMRSYIKGVKFEKRVTNLVDEFCDKIESLNIEDWGNHKYWDEGLFFATFWKLKIKTTKFYLDCTGKVVFPENWEEFHRILNRFAVPN